jgi:hypothetical protein
MTAPMPTRITIEVHPSAAATGAAASGPWSESADATQAPPIVRVLPGAGAAPTIVSAAPREDVPSPAAYDAGPCLCLDDEDCGADHAND